MFLAPTRLVLFLLTAITCRSGSSIASEDVLVSADTDISVSKKDWLEDCRQSGFDPTQLACRTCQLLPEDNQKACLGCCQSYKDVEHISKPYEAAVLVVSGRSAGEEFERFLDEDWDDLVKTKGANRLLQIPRGDRGGNSFSMFFAPPTVLYLLDEKHAGEKKSASAYATIAKETLHLDGWKRDDIRDMLSTLLS
jgi:hypothetical protein